MVAGQTVISETVSHQTVSYQTLYSAKKKKSTPVRKFNTFVKTIDLILIL